MAIEKIRVVSKPPKARIQAIDNINGLFLNQNSSVSLGSSDFGIASYGGSDVTSEN